MIKNYWWGVPWIVCILIGLASNEPIITMFSSFFPLTHLAIIGYNCNHSSYFELLGEIVEEINQESLRSDKIFTANTAISIINSKLPKEDKNI